MTPRTSAPAAQIIRRDVIGRSRCGRAALVAARAERLAVGVGRCPMIKPAGEAKTGGRRPGRHVLSRSTPKRPDHARVSPEHRPRSWQRSHPEPRSHTHRSRGDRPLRRHDTHGPGRRTPRPWTRLSDLSQSLRSGMPERGQIPRALPRRDPQFRTDTTGPGSADREISCPRTREMNCPPTGMLDCPLLQRGALRCRLKGYSSKHGLGPSGETFGRSGRPLSFCCELRQLRGSNRARATPAKVRRRCQRTGPRDTTGRPPGAVYSLPVGGFTRGTTELPSASDRHASTVLCPSSSRLVCLRRATCDRVRAACPSLHGTRDPPYA